MQMCCIPTQISIKKKETKKIKHLLEWVMDACVRGDVLCADAECGHRWGMLMHWHANVVKLVGC